MHMMNFANRGFGGPPQPQRQGGRRGNRGGGGGGGGFRNNSRFDQEQPRNQNSGGQRPNNVPDKPAQGAEQAKPLQQPQAGQPKPVQDTPIKPVQQPVQQAKPQPSPQQAQQPPKPQPSPVQQQQPKPAQAQLPKAQSQENLNKSLEQKQPIQGNQNQQQQHNQQSLLHNTQQHQQQNQQHQQQNQQYQQQNQQQQKNFNGNYERNFGGNKGGGWSQGQGGPGNKQGGNRPFFNKQGGPGGQDRSGPARNQQNRMSRGPHDGNPAQREEQMLANKLKDMAGPILDLPPIDQSEIKFNGRSRLYIGNLTNDVTEEEITKMFSAFGEIAELFLNKEKNFGFIKMDFRVNAERAKHELDGKMRNGKTLRVRFAPHNSAVRVKNLPPFVSNELLYRAFEIFGKIERAYVKVDERGRTVGEGVVEYVRKPSALAAIRNCTEKCFFLTASLRPVIVESYEEPDELDGYPEKNLPKKHPEFLKAREMGPRFSEAGSFEHEYGTRWKQLHELHRQKEEALKKELSSEEEKLEAQMEYAKYEHETELLREQLRQREKDRDRQKRSWEMAERAADERREAERAALLRQEEELSQRMRLQDDELRRRQQENTLFVQAQRLNSMLDRQEQGMFEQQPMEGGGFREQFDNARPGGFDDSRGWEGPRQLDDYPNKRRRY